MTKPQISPVERAEFWRFWKWQYNCRNTKYIEAYRKYENCLSQIDKISKERTVSDKDVPEFVSLCNSCQEKYGWVCGVYYDPLDYVCERHGLSLNEGLRYLGISPGPMTVDIRRRIRGAQRVREAKQASEQCKADLLYTPGGSDPKGRSDGDRLARVALWLNEAAIYFV